VTQSTVSTDAVNRLLKGVAGERTFSYVEAVREAADQEMERDPSVIVFGLDVDDPKAIQGTTRGPRGKVRSRPRLRHAPVEDAMSGAAIGMALGGLRPSTSTSAWISSCWP